MSTAPGMRFAPSGRLVEHSDPAEPAAAARILGNIADRYAVEPLVSSLKDENRQARRNGAAAWRWIKDPRAVEPLLAALMDEHEALIF